MPKQTKEKALIPHEKIEQKIFLLRGKKVMLDRDLAELYSVPTKRLNEQVKRNIKRFPDEFMFQLTKKEKEEAVANRDHLKPLIFSPQLPYAFTEPGVAMLSSVLNSEKAIQINIQIIKTFVKMREMIISNKELRQRLDKLEQKYNKQFKIVFTALREILTPKEESRRQIGFDTDVNNNF